MICLQLIIYVGFIILQSLISKFALNIPFSIINLIMPLLLVVLLHYLCVNYHFTVANVLVGLVIVLGIISDIYVIFNTNNTPQVAQAVVQFPVVYPSTAPAAQQRAQPSFNPSTAPAAQQRAQPSFNPSTAPAAQQRAQPVMQPGAHVVQPIISGNGTIPTSY